MPQYTPEPTPGSVDPVLAEWIQRELMRISNAFIGSDDEATGYQPLDQDLTDIAALATQAWGRQLLTFSTEAAFKTYANLDPGLNIHAAGSKNPPADSDEFGYSNSTASWGLVKFTWAQLKSAVRTYLLGLANTWTVLQTFTGAFPAIELSGASPTIKYSDTDASAHDYWLHVNSSQFYILCDRDNDGTWDGTFPMQLDSTTDTPYLFGFKAWTQGNDGAGSGLDADLLDGFNSAQTNTVSTVAVRDASGDVVARLHRTEWAGQGWNGAFFVGMNANGGVNTDNYMRPATPNQALTAIFGAGYQSAQQTITNAGALTLAHGLGVQPKLYAAFLQCTTAELGYSIGNEVIVNPGGGTSSKGLSIVPDATNLNVRMGSAALDVVRKDTGAGATITNASWKLVFRAWG